MVLRGLRGDVQAGSDLGVRAALADEVEHFVLPDAELAHGSVLPVGRAGAHRCAELAQEGRRPVSRRDRAEPLEHRNRGTGFVDRPCRVSGGAQRVGEREASGGGEVRTVSEPLTRTLEVLRRGGAVAGGRGDPAARKLRLSRERVDLGLRCQICQPVGGIGCRSEVSERDLGLDQSREQRSAADGVALHLLETAARGGGGEPGLARDQADTGDGLAREHVVPVWSDERLRILDAALLDADAREVHRRLHTVAEAPRGRRCERLGHDLFGLGPASGGCEERAVRDEAVRGEHLRPAAVGLEHRLADHAHPLFDPIHIAGAVAARQHRAEAATSE